MPVAQCACSEARPSIENAPVSHPAVQARVAKSHLDEFQEEVVKRRKVLRRLNHITEDGLLTAKGKAAAEVCFASHAGKELWTAQWVTHCPSRQSLQSLHAERRVSACLTPTLSTLNPSKFDAA